MCWTVMISFKVYPVFFSCWLCPGIVSGNDCNIFFIIITSVVWFNWFSFLEIKLFCRRQLHNCDFAVGINQFDVCHFKTIHDARNIKCQFRSNQNGNRKYHWITVTEDLLVQEGQDIAIISFQLSKVCHLYSKYHYSNLYKRLIRTYN